MTLRDDAGACKEMRLRTGTGKVKHLSTKQLWTQRAIQSFPSFTVCVCVSACMYVCMHMYVHTYMYRYMYVCVLVRTRSVIVTTL